MASPDKHDKLIIALEPEAASLYCHQLEIAERNEAGAAIMAQIKPGVRYVVIDCGGGTVDCTVHEITEKRHIRALQAASGGAWGGTRVDKNFETLLANVFGEENLRQFKETQPGDWIELMSSNFENRKKEAVSPGRSLAVRIDSLAMFLREEGLTPEQMVRDFNNPQITLRRGALRMEQDEAMKLFKPVVDKIEEHVTSVVQRINGLKYIIMVGGFSESNYLERRIKTTFEGQLRVIVPHDARLSVVKGAVIFGQDPTSICERRTVHTVGIGTTQPFIEGYHRPTYRIRGTTPVDDLCDNVFETYIKADEAVGVGNSVQKSFTPSYEGQMEALVDIFFSRKKEVWYTVEDEVWQKGYMLVPLNGFGLNREVKVSIYFGETEFKVTACDRTGTEQQVKLDFLGKFN